MKKQILLREQKNANRTYYYAENQLAEELLALMQRKTFVEADFPKLKRLGASLQIELVLKAVATEKEL